LFFAGFLSIDVDLLIRIIGVPLEMEVRNPVLYAVEYNNFYK